MAQCITGYCEHLFRTVVKNYEENGRCFRIDNLASPSPRPNLTYTYKGFKPPKNGWAISKEKMIAWDKEGRLFFPKKNDGRIQRKRYLDELKGKTIQNLWDDIEMISSHAAERLGYPTQKPEALLERIISASSNVGDVVLDPFCGCGTTVTVAEKFNRKWIGIDITHLAISLMKHRLESAYGNELSSYEIIGDPKDLSGAIALSYQDKYQFEWWTLSLVGARPAHDKKKGADKGIDGYIYFFDDESGKAKKIVVQVKGGNVTVSQIRDLAHVIEREQASIGVFISLNKHTKPMKTEAAGVGFYEAPDGTQYPKMQILTIQELFDDKKIDYPRYKFDVTHKKAQRKSMQKLDKQTKMGI